jgi:hypothetical protein
VAGTTDAPIIRIRAVITTAGNMMVALTTAAATVATQAAVMVVAETAAAATAAAGAESDGVTLPGTSPSQRRPRQGPTILLAMCAVLSAGGTAFAAIAARQNAHRAERYAADPVCHVAPSLGQLDTLPPSPCMVAVAMVTAQYVHTNRGARYYRLALRTADGVVDSIEAKGANDKAIWGALPVGSRVAVQRFLDDGARLPHVTIVAVNGLSARTEWNPAWQAGNTQFGVWFMGIATLVCGIALVWVRRRR